MNSHHRNWCIKGKALAKIAICEYHNANDDGNFFCFDMVDKEEFEIHVTYFNAVANKFYDVVGTNFIYIIYNAHIEEANK